MRLNRISNFLIGSAFDGNNYIRLAISSDPTNGSVHVHTITFSRVKFASNQDFLTSRDLSIDIYGYETIDLLGIMGNGNDVTLFHDNEILSGSRPHWHSTMSALRNVCEHESTLKKVSMNSQFFCSASESAKCGRTLRPRQVQEIHHIPL